MASATGECPSLLEGDPQYINPILAVASEIRRMYLKAANYMTVVTIVFLAIPLLHLLLLKWRMPDRIKARSRHHGGGGQRAAGVAAAPAHPTAGVLMLRGAPLEAIFSRLNEVDRVSAMGVCRAWRRHLQGSAALRPLLHLECPVRAEGLLFGVTNTFSEEGQRMLARLPQLIASSLRMERYFGSNQTFAAVALATLPAGLTHLHLDFRPATYVLSRLPHLTALRQLEVTCPPESPDQGMLHVAALAQNLPASVTTLRLTELYLGRPPGWMGQHFFGPLRGLSQLQELGLTFPYDLECGSDEGSPYLPNLEGLPVTQLELGRWLRLPEDVGMLGQLSMHMCTLRQLSQLAAPSSAEMMMPIVSLLALTSLDLPWVLPREVTVAVFVGMLSHLQELSCTWYAVPSVSHEPWLPERWSLTNLTSLSLSAHTFSATPSCVLPLTTLHRLSLVSRYGSCPMLRPGPYLHRLEALECRGCRPSLPLATAAFCLLTPNLRKLHLFLPLELSESQMDLLAEGLPRLQQLRVGFPAPQPAWCDELIRRRPSLHLFLEVRGGV